MLKRRHVNVKTVKELDAFPKVPELYTDKTAVGGTCKLADVDKIRCLPSHVRTHMSQNHYASSFVSTFAYFNYFLFQFPFSPSSSLHT